MTRINDNISLALIIGVVTVVINIFAFLKNYTGTYLWAYDITYVAGNSVHAVAFSLSSKGMKVSTEQKQEN
ncbi:MAG: hypothetical protein ACYCSA_07315 [Thermoplasmataceae archaeon]|jgi:hypothetical protein|nr:hypothetical protein [Candidatus Thermoplasmatota archaeon]